MKTEQFDARFDGGEDITDYLDIDKTQRPAPEQRRANVDFLAWMIDMLQSAHVFLKATGCFEA